MKRLLISVFSCFLICWPLMSQQYAFAEDEWQQGWYDRPYSRYEAEEGLCSSTGAFLERSDDQSLLQSEASHQQAVQLTRQGDYVEWTLEDAAEGMTIRFSLPDGADGRGTKGAIEITYSGPSVLPEDMFSTTLTLDSYWAWQYTTKGGNFPDNTPADNKMVRMRFDETHLLLPKTMLGGEMQRGGKLRITKTDDNQVPFTIDFIELEKVPAATTFESLTDEQKVCFNPATDGDVADFISINQGKTIFLPAGKHITNKRIRLTKADTRLIGAGEWYTEIYFAASSDDGNTYSNRGIEASGSNIYIEGLYLNTVNNKRYYQNNDSKQVGKGFMGSWGKGSVITHCWVEHFECGAWIGSYSDGWSENLTVEYCRFRNNYADGINFSQRCRGNSLTHSSLRNNGDDDMASWTTSSNMSSNCSFAYCTAENNWRASSLGFFGGENHEAHHIAIYDPLECGVRLNADFQGKGFGTSGRIYLHHITIRHAGCKSGTIGKAGDFWGNMQGAFNIGSTNYYDVNNVYCESINIIDSRSNAMLIRSGQGHQLNNLVLSDININGAQQWGIYYSAAKGNARYCRINIEDCTSGDETKRYNLQVVESCDDNTDVEQVRPTSAQSTYKVLMDNQVLIVNGQTKYDLLGRVRHEK